jgi:hypothetical protein
MLGVNVLCHVLFIVMMNAITMSVVMLNVVVVNVFLLNVVILNVMAPYQYFCRTNAGK